MTYRAPLDTIRWALATAGFADVQQQSSFAEASDDLVDAVLDEAAKFAEGVLAPINHAGDKQGARWDDGAVTTPDGWKEAYTQFYESGWMQLSASPEFGGQGLPYSVGACVNEMWKSANMAFSLCPLLSHGAIEALEQHGSDALKAQFLEKMIEGRWTGTMNLTEPQAGTDLAALRSRAVPEGDHYRISGQKIFITYGEHDLVENICHLVLARLPDAPDGVRGISLFLVPKFLLDADGNPGERNDLRCVSIEHKLGIHGSPTCVMSYGDNDGAVGYLIGQENAGLACMFTMMNAARHAVGMEGYSLSERAYQHALGYARDRVQGKAMLAGADGARGIINHPDVRRMLMDMRSRTEAMRMLGLEAACAYDLARHADDPAVRAASDTRGALLTPVVKGWCTETAQRVTYDGVQIHGGMGFIEETGAAQYYRDARITTIYEGTTGIQANDLVGRKFARDGGAAFLALLDEVEAQSVALTAETDSELAQLGQQLREACDEVSSLATWMLSEERAMHHAPAAAVPFMMATGVLLGGWMHARSAVRATAALGEPGADTAFLSTRIALARYYGAAVLAEVFGLVQTARGVGESVALLDEAAM
ncbi:MAG: acyl-CoA dehydrogenase [Pseudomonadota bacterium]